MLELVTSAAAQEQVAPVPAPPPVPPPQPAPAPVAAPAAEPAPAHGAVEAEVGQEPHASVGEAAEEHGAFPPFAAETYGSQLLWLAITFGLLYWFLSKVALPRIGGILEERDNKIGADLAAAGKLSEESNAALAAYEQALAEARQRAQGIAGEARSRSKAETDAERTRLEAEVNARMVEAETRIASVKERALGEVDAIARDAAEALVETLIGPRASPAEIAAAVSAVQAEARA